MKSLSQINIAKLTMLGTPEPKPDDERVIKIKPNEILRPEDLDADDWLNGGVGRQTKCSSELIDPQIPAGDGDGGPGERRPEKQFRLWKEGFEHGYLLLHEETGEEDPAN